MALDIYWYKQRVFFTSDTVSFEDTIELKYTTKDIVFEYENYWVERFH